MVNSLREGVVLTGGMDFFSWNSRHYCTTPALIFWQPQLGTAHRWSCTSRRWHHTSDLRIVIGNAGRQQKPRSWDPWPPTRKSPPSEVANSFGSRRKPKGKLIWAQRKKVLSFTVGVSVDDVIPKSPSVPILLSGVSNCHRFSGNTQYRKNIDMSVGTVLWWFLSCTNKQSYNIKE